MTDPRPTPLKERDGYREQVHAPWAAEINAVLDKHGIRAAVLLTIEPGDRVGAVPFGSTARWLKAMNVIADRVLVDFDDGRYDDAALVVLPAEGQA